MTENNTGISAITHHDLLQSAIVGDGTAPGPWKPALRCSEGGSNTVIVFCDESYPNTSGVGLPMHFTLDCIQIERPA